MRHYAFYGALTGAFLLLMLSVPGLAQAPAWQALNAITGTAANGVVDTEADASGNVYVLGWYFGSVKLGSTTLSGPLYNYSMYVAKWSPLTSTYVWVLSAANGYTVLGSSMVLSGSSLYVTGQFSGSYVSLGSQLISYTANGYPANSTDGFLAKITDAGSSASFT